MKKPVEIKVRGYHLDMFSHVNNARYLEFLEEARWSALENTEVETLMASKNLSFIVVSITIDYKYPAVFGDILSITTELIRTGRKSGTLHQVITSQGGDVLVVNADVTFVLFDNATGKAVEIDDALKAAMSKCWNK